MGPPAKDPSSGNLLWEGHPHKKGTCGMNRGGYYKYLGPEDHLHHAVITYLNAQYPHVFWFHPPQEGKRSRFEQWKAKWLGLRRGISDLIFLEPFGEFHGLVMELKAGKNKATAHQKEFIRVAREKGFRGEVCTGFEEAKAILDQCFGRGQ